MTRAASSRLASRTCTATPAAFSSSTHAGDAVGDGADLAEHLLESESGDRGDRDVVAVLGAVAADEDDLGPEIRHGAQVAQRAARHERDRRARQLRQRGEGREPVGVGDGVLGPVDDRRERPVDVARDEQRPRRGDLTQRGVQISIELVQRHERVPSFAMRDARVA